MGNRAGNRIETYFEDVYFEELEDSVPILEAVDPSLVAESYAGDILVNIFLSGDLWFLTLTSFFWVWDPSNQLQVEFLPFAAEMIESGRI
jgi:hypothetical protein